MLLQNKHIEVFFLGSFLSLPKGVFIGYNNNIVRQVKSSLQNCNWKHIRILLGFFFPEIPTSLISGLDQKEIDRFVLFTSSTSTSPVSGISWVLSLQMLEAVFLKHFQRIKVTYSVFLLIPPVEFRYPELKATEAELFTALQLLFPGI